LRGRGKVTDLSVGATVDREEFLQVSVLQDSIERTTFIGKDGVGIAVDPVSGVAGTAWPLGTRSDPVDNMADAHQVAENNGFKNIYAMSSITVDENMTHGYTFYADNPQTVQITLDPLGDISTCKFQDAYVQGKLGPSGGNILWECIVGTVTNLNGFIYKSSIEGPMTVLDDTSINKCWVAPTAIASTVTIDFNNLDKAVYISQWEQGKIKVINMAAGSTVHMAGTGGVLIVDASCNASAEVANGGSIKLINNSSATPSSAGTVADQVWSNKIEGTFTSAEVLRIMSAALAGKASGLDSAAPVFRDINDTVDRITATTDSNGNRTAVTLVGS